MPIDANVQKALVEMAKATVEIMNKNGLSPTLYQPSEKHAGIEYLYLPSSDQMAQTMKELHEALNLPINSNVLKIRLKFSAILLGFLINLGKS